MTTSNWRATRVQLIASLWLAVAWCAAPAAAQSGDTDREQAEPLERESRLQVYAYALQHKEAGEALALIRPLLSTQGTVELQPQDNTLVVRDTLAALGRIVPRLRAFDRPAQELRIEIMLVRAFSRPVPVGPEQTLPSWLEERLQGFLRWDHYQVLADSGVDTREGQAVVHEIGRLYGVRFQLGSLVEGDRIHLHEFRVWRGPEGEEDPLLEANLSLWLEKPKVLALASSESSDHALMVVLTCQRVSRAAEPVTPPQEGDG
ncbi:MAG: hypothetical protein ACLF0P_09770 [Thermoanaerobaculia bacterium]